MGVANLNKSLAVIDSQWSDGSPATARRVSLPLVDPMTPISAEATELPESATKTSLTDPPFGNVAAKMAGCFKTATSAATKCSATCS